MLPLVCQGSARSKAESGLRYSASEAEVRGDGGMFSIARRLRKDKLSVNELKSSYSKAGHLQNDGTVIMYDARDVLLVHSSSNAVVSNW